MAKRMDQYHDVRMAKPSACRVKRFSVAFTVHTDRKSIGSATSEGNGSNPSG
jgi:hypothetical protein